MKLKIVSVIALIVVAALPSVKAGCACACVEVYAGSGMYDEYVYDPELASSEACGFAPQGTCDGFVELNMACYKCGQSLDCVVDDVGTSITKSEVKAIIEDQSYFCGDTQGRNKVTCSGQQNCDNLSVGFTSDGVCMPTPVIGSAQCPISGQGLSNFGTYTVKVANGANCWSCSASASCAEGSGNDSITTTCSVSSNCVSVSTEVVCASDKCDTACDAECSFCSSCTRRLNAPPQE
ncbi:expressed unknown protein [Seminavis robusta]|uniref:Uncharacterized protein n=1 Tax=Seminavis robusta TaxID=568900 RepID=A0A9N8D568_9STRA|nr:expressed unknown protein [Seminavis robusta]|eukprot:Sro3_g002590.1 n/a (236) ;mRNA; r:199127-199834